MGASRLLIALFAWVLAMPAWAGVSIQHWTTPQGARVYFVRNHDLPMLDVAVDFPAGSRCARGLFLRQGVVLRGGDRDAPRRGDGPGQRRPAKIALLYWLGRCDEELGRPGDALNWFQRVFALDIRFADVAKRVQQLSAGGH